MIQLQLKDFHLPSIFREVVASCIGRKSWLSYHWHDSKTKLNVLDWRVISRSFAHVTTVKTDYLEVSKTNQPPTGINMLRQCHWCLHCRARRSHLLSSILIPPNRDAIEPQILGHFGKYGIMFGTNWKYWNHFILKEPNSDLYTFFCDPNGAGQRRIYHQRMHLKGSFGPEFNGCASPKTELSANGEAEWATHVRRFLVLTITSENPRSWPRPMEFGMLKLLGSESEKTWALGSTSGWAKNRTNSEWTKNAVSVPTKQKKQNKWLIHISSD